MNNNYWKKWYKEKHSLEPSDFAKFCLNLVRNKNVIDIGCGNGRDSYFLGQYCKSLIGVDANSLPEDKGNIKFIKKEIAEMIKKECEFDIVYSRFVLHAIKNKDIKKLVRWTDGMFIAECRAEKDVPIIYKKHKRTKANGEELIRLLIDNGFKILYYKKAHGLAKYKEEDPLIIRIIAKK